MSEIEEQLKTTFTEIVAHDPATDALADRLIATAIGGDRAVVPLRRRGRLFTPLLAAAVVVLVAAGVLVGTRLLADRPSVTPPVAPITTAPLTSEEPPKPPSWFIGEPELLGPASWFTTIAPRATGLPPGFVPQSVQFLDDTTGFLLGAGTCSGVEGDCGGLYRTADGGATWTSVGRLDAAAGGTSGAALCPPGSPDLASCTSGLHFTDAADGVVWGNGVVYATSDGGDAWQRIDGADRQLVSVRQIGSTILALGYDDSSSTNLLVSSSGASFAPAGGRGADDGVRGLVSAGDRWYSSVTSAEEPTQIISTTDGRTWRTEPTPPCFQGLLDDMPADTLVVSCYDPDTLSWGGAVLEPGSTTWTRFAGAPLTFAAAGDSVSLAAFVDAEHFAVSVRSPEGNPERFVWGITDDGGAHWATTASADGFPPAPISSVPPDDPGGRVLADSLLARGYLVVSTDLGRTWTARAVR